MRNKGKNNCMSTGVRNPIMGRLEAYPGKLLPGLLRALHRDRPDVIDHIEQAQLEKHATITTRMVQS
jgi:hypothetical protein